MTGMNSVVSRANPMNRTYFGFEFDNLDREEKLVWWEKAKEWAADEDRSKFLAGYSKEERQGIMLAVAASLWAENKKVK